MNKRNDYETSNTKNTLYAKRLLKIQTAKWKEWLDVQAPYRWNLQRLNMGFTFDVGCGIGRNLINLNGSGMGIDHNLDSVEICKNRGLTAFTPDDFEKSSLNVPESFDSILLSHVAEHISYPMVINILKKYLYLLKCNGKLVIITPQELGYKSDASHVEFMNFPKLRGIANQLDLRIIKEYSFPFPRLFGHIFMYNEFVMVAQKNYLQIS